MDAADIPVPAPSPRGLTGSLVCCLFWPFRPGNSTSSLASAADEEPAPEWDDLLEEGMESEAEEVDPEVDPVADGSGSAQKDEVELDAKHTEAGLWGVIVSSRTKVEKVQDEIIANNAAGSGAGARGELKVASNHDAKCQVPAQIG